MERRLLGRTGLEVSGFCFGTWEIGGAYWGPVDAGDAVKLLHQALDLGVTVYDLSDVYGNGRSEAIVGAAFRARRDEVLLVTKAGYIPGIDGAQQLFTRQLQCFEMEYLAWACEMSLRRLQTDRIDVFLLHDAPTEVLASEAPWVALRDLKREGKILHYGASTSDEGGLVAIEAGRAEVLEVPFNLLTPQAADALLPLAQRCGVGVLARSPFAGGRLFREGDAAFQFLTRKGARSLTHAAIQFPLAHDAVSSVVTGVMRPDELAENVAACRPPYFTEDELRGAHHAALALRAAAPRTA
jgi:aryl-alcohol dehydrogenase-like predicted oxidoreductase